MGMRQWNDDVEKYMALDPPSDPSRDGNEAVSENTLVQVASALRQRIVNVVLERDVPSSTESDDSEEDARQATETFRATPLSPCPPILSEYIRTSKNYARWYIQIFSAQQRPGATLASPIVHLQSPSLIGLLVTMLEQYTLNATTSDQQTARLISLHLFYATYVVSPSDKGTQNALECLVVQLKFPTLVLRILTRSCTAALSLSLIRNIHNAIVTLPYTADMVLNTHVGWDASDSKFPDPAPWNPSTTSRSLNFTTTCINILRWTLASDPPFPGDKTDHRAELVSEIVGALYAIRAGKVLDSTGSDDHWGETIVDLLQLPNPTDDIRVIQCKTSTTSLLMDTDGSFSNYLLESGAIPSLLHLFDDRVSDVVDNGRVDQTSTAALVPILVVLNKYATVQPEIKALVTDCVFPPDDEAVYQEKLRERRQVQEGSLKKNMGPLDAPPGTLRQKLCKLLTWPESHIKRCTGELLWTLCSSNPTEFVHRVGFGNALPLLSLKGFAQMPQSV